MGTDKPRLRLLLVEDSEDDAILLLRALETGGYSVTHRRVETLLAFEHALAHEEWDIVISDYSLPGLNGLHALAAFQRHDVDIPFFLISGSVGEERAVEAMRAGAHDYIMKGHLARLARAIARELKEAEVRRTTRRTYVHLKNAEDHLGRLKRFFSPSIAELAASGSLDDPFKWHRKDVTVVFTDLHGFTNFVEISEPEVVIGILQEYYSEIGKVVQKYGGTVGHVAGDGIMIFLNDPLDVAEPEKKGVLMALEIRALMSRLITRWEQLEYPLDFGAGVASGFATIGGAGADGCWDYSIFGTVTNTASRLCGHATNGQILVSKRFLSPLKDLFDVELVGDLTLKGLNRTVCTYNVIGSREAKA